MDNATGLELKEGSEPFQLKESYNIGDAVWIFAGDCGPDGKPRMSPGTVVSSFITPYRALEQFIILLDDPNFAHMEIRDVYLMSPSCDIEPAFRQKKLSQGLSIKIDDYENISGMSHDEKSLN